MKLLEKMRLFGRRIFQKLQAIEINLGLKIVTIQLAIPLRRVLSANLTNQGITSPYMEILVCCGVRA